MRKLRTPLAVAVVAGAGLAAVTGVGSAAASPAHMLHVVRTLPGDFVGPLQFAVSGRTVAVADSFTSSLYLVGHTAPIATGFPPSSDPETSGDLAGVDVRGGEIGYTTSKGDHSDTRFIVLSHGHRVLDVNLAKYEARHNPDGHVTYGPTTTPSAKCSAELTEVGAPTAAYRGQVDSHPYAVAGLKDGSWLVADAGGNDILRVSRWGHVSTVAVLPADTITVPPAAAASLGVPDCGGLTYRFEGVPTDVEVTRAGVYVSALGGGAEIGDVYELGRHGSMHKLVGGIPGATNIAVTPSGCVYVVELGTGVFRLAGGGLQEVAALPGAAGAEWANGHLYASTAPAATGGSGAGHVVVLG